MLHLLRRLYLGCFKGDLDKVLLCTWGASISQAFVAKRAMNSFQDVFTNVHCRFIRNAGRASSYVSLAPAATRTHADNGFATMLRDVLRCF